MYNKAKLEKLKQIKRLMYELMAEEGNGEMSSEDLESKLDEAGAMVEGEEAEMSPDIEGGMESAEMEMESPDGEMEEEEEEEMDMFPKKEKRPSKILIASHKTMMPKPSLESAVTAMKSKKGRY